MAIDPKETLSRLKGEAEKVRFSLYVAESLMEEFKELCGDKVSPSRIIEDMIRDFVSTAKAQQQAASLPSDVAELASKIPTEDGVWKVVEKLLENRAAKLEQELARKAL